MHKERETIRKGSDEAHVNFREVEANYLDSTKVCTKCELRQPLSNFRSDRSRKDGLQFRCKTCQIIDNAKPHRKAARKASREKKASLRPKRISLTREEKLERRKIRQSTPEFKEKKRLSAQKHRSKPEVREKNRARSAWYRSLPENKKTRREKDKKRKSEDVQYALSCALRSRLKRAVYGNIKGASAVHDLGCSIEECRSHLESKFQPGMSWDNHGLGKDRWNIDHIIPLVAFNLANRQHALLACHYLNLQPLWTEDNLAKRTSDRGYAKFSKTVN